TGAVDCGFAVNPNGVRAQMEGGACDALSTALGEELTIDGGRHRETNFHQYRLMRMNQAPRRLDVHIVRGGSEPTGLGEPPVPPPAAGTGTCQRHIRGDGQAHPPPADSRAVEGLM